MGLAVARNAEMSNLFLLVVDDEQTTVDVCRDVAAGMGFRTEKALSAETALRVLEEKPIDVVLVDLRLPGEDGLALLKRIKETYGGVEVILMTGHASYDSALEAGKSGVFHYLPKPFRTEELRTQLRSVTEQISLRRENAILREQVQGRPGFGDLVGMTNRMKAVYRLIEKVSRSNCPVLVLGESGTGKELAARAIHFQSERKDRPFVPVDCAGLVPTLVESELFGYVKGAFTGASRSKPGLMETASTGTLFLDEIGELPIDMQVKMLRALQEKEIRPVGGTERIPIDVRVVAATNHDLAAAVRNGTFRQDLYFRLNVVAVKMPPLRERRKDIPYLVHHFLESATEGTRPVGGVSEGAMDRLSRYDWPGNVRELENVIQRAIALGSDPVIGEDDLPSNLQNPPREAPAIPTQDTGVIPLRELEKRAILHAVEEVGGDKMMAARFLGIGKTTLYRKLKEYELEALSQ